jgi:hypothetical protein
VARALLYAHRSIGDFGNLALAQQPAELATPK